MARVILKSRNIPIKLWVEAVNTTCYISNRVYLRPGTHKNPYKIWKGKKPNLKKFHEFGSPCYILNDREPGGKFDVKSDEGVSIRYTSNIRAYRVYNRRIMAIMESINVKVNDYLLLSSYPRPKDPPMISPT